jgi:hypothetical protein
MAVLAVLAATDASAAPQKLKFKADRIEIKYIEPETPDHQPVFKLLKESRALEKLRDLLRPMRLPRPLLVQTQSCKGMVNAWYQQDIIRICYELVDDIWKNAAEKTTPAGIAPIDTMIGPFVFVVLHESGHALFEMLNLPVIGRVEDAADQFATYFMLLFEKDEARRLITGSAYRYKADVAQPTTTLAQQAFAEEHGLPAQRFYNLLCMAYGGDPVLFADFVTEDYLPEARAERCRMEFVQAANGFAALLSPHIDFKLAAKQPKRWLVPADSKPQGYRGTDPSVR